MTLNFSTYFNNLTQYLNNFNDQTIKNSCPAAISPLNHNKASFDISPEVTFNRPYLNGYSCQSNEHLNKTIQNLNSPAKMQFHQFLHSLMSLKPSDLKQDQSNTIHDLSVQPSTISAESLDLWNNSDLSTLGGSTSSPTDNSSSPHPNNSVKHTSRSFDQTFYNNLSNHDIHHHATIPPPPSCNNDEAINLSLKSSPNKKQALPTTLYQRYYSQLMHNNYWNIQYQCLRMLSNSVDTFQPISPTSNNHSSWSPVASNQHAFESPKIPTFNDCTLALIRSLGQQQSPHIASPPINHYTYPMANINHIGNHTMNAVNESTPYSSPHCTINVSPHQTLPTNQYACKLCNKVYAQASALKMHIRTHTLPCRCVHCGKSFSRKWLLKGHERIHTGEKPYSCTVCTRSFADRSNLRAHMQTHQKHKRYSCHLCPRSFSRIGLLNKHIVQCRNAIEPQS